MAKHQPPRDPSKRIVIIAGPNGAGKTTFAAEYLQREIGCPRFINADLIAQGLSPFAPEKVAFRAARTMLHLIRDSVRRGQSFAFETTLSGVTYAHQIPRWRNAGYVVVLVFLSLPSVDIALARIKSRVAQGGHDVPESTVHRRFDAGLKNFRLLYQPLVDNWLLYDNAGATPELLAAGVNQ